MYQIISEDIVDFHIDGKKTAIINSLGYQDSLSLPGALFRSILDSCNNPKGLEDEVVSLGSKQPFGSVFETSSYGLPCSGILHSITPYAEDDDEKLSKLLNTYKALFRLALESHYEAILVPTIGTGANGYQTGDVFEMLKRFAYGFASEHPDIDVYLNVFYIEHTERLREIEEESWLLRRRSINRNFVQGKFRPENRFRSQNRAKDQKTPLRMLEVRKGENFVELINDYVINNFPLVGKKTKNGLYNEKWNEIFLNLGKAGHRIKEGLTKAETEASIKENTDKATQRKKDLWRSNYGKRKIISDGQTWIAPRKAELLIIAWTLKMTVHDLYFLMRFCGYYLNDWNEEDIVIKECIPMIEEDNGLVDIIIHYSREFGQSIYIG